MAAITLKNIPEELYKRIKENAARNRRSINSEIIICLERLLETRPIDTEETLSRINHLNKEVSLPPLTDDFLRKAKNAGRP